MLATFRFLVAELWRRTLRRRSQKDRTKWERITELADQWLPPPRILHPWPELRFAVTHPRREPYARIGHVRFCAGGAQQGASLPPPARLLAMTGAHGASRLCPPYAPNTSAVIVRNQAAA